MELVLDTTDATPGPEFRLLGGDDNAMFAHCDTHTGGTWTLQVKSPAGVWTDTDAEFDGTGLQVFDMPRPAVCRWVGGSTGARIYCTGVLSG